MPARAQESEEIIVQGRRYLNINIRSLSKYENRLERKQQQLLGRLKKKEKNFERSLKRKDSVAYARYKAQNLTFDSIAKLSRVDSSDRINGLSSKPNKVIDSLKGVTSFINQAAGNSSELAQKADIGKYSSELSGLKSKLNYRAYIDELISKRTTEMRSVSKGSVSGLTGIEQQVYYARAQISVYKGIAEDPSKLEEKAYEFLQGQMGFDEGINKAVNGVNPLAASSGGSGLTATDLEKMGFQTKRQLNTSLQQKFGSSASAVQQQMGSKIQDWQKQSRDITSQLKETKQNLKSLKNASKPSFKINPMRCLPFWQRVERSYDFQTSRATADGKPAQLQLGGMMGYRHNPKLTTGLGMSVGFGLGKDWSSIRLSFEGVGLRSFASWQMIYGIGAYAGYERIYKRAAFSKSQPAESLIIPTIHSTPTYSESTLLGITKSYQINSKYNGAFQLLYDFWWKEKGLASPFLIRLTTKTK